MDDDLRDLKRRGLYRVRRRLRSSQGIRVRIANRDYLNFSSNDYLDLASDPRLARAAARAARQFGCGAGASPLVSGLLPPLAALERSLARWEETESALVFSSGYAANLALTSTLVGRDDVVFSDALNHASLIDGCRLSRARVHVYRHADVHHLEQLLRTERGARRRLIVTDSVFSMDGDFAPLTELIDLAQQQDALLLVDEAHATGVLGRNGRGLLDGVNRDDVVRVGTLSKALGSQGGFVSGTKLLRDWLVNRARPYIFSTALAPPAASAARRALTLVQREPERRERVLRLAAQLRERLRDTGYSVGASCCQIVPILIGEARATVELSARLREVGLLVPAIRPPSVPSGSARLRISLTAGHTEEHVERLVAALTQAPRS